LIIVDNKGNIIPAFDVEDRPNDQGSPLNNEMALIYNVVPSIAREFVEFNINQSKKQVEIGNKAATATALRMLEKGDLPVEEWGYAFSVMSNVNPDSALKAAVEGYSKKNPYINTTDSVSMAIKIMDTYPEMNKDSNVSVSTAKPTY